MADTELKYISYVISNFWSTNVVFNAYPENVTTTDNTHKCCLAYYLKTKMTRVIQKLYKEARRLQCNWGFMNKIEVKI